MAPVRNLVIVLAHGLRSDAIGDDRSWPLHTPALERLGAAGVRLAASSASPTDAGGLTSLLTGLHARQHGVLGQNGAAPPRLEQALPRWLREAGYTVAGVGCVGPVAHWLDESVVVAPPGEVEPKGCAYFERMSQRGLADALVEQRANRLRGGPFEPTRLLIEPEDDIDGFIGREATRLAKRLPADRPWALLVMFSGPGNDLPPPTLYESVVEASALQSGFVPADLRALDALAEPAYPRAMLQRLEPATVGRLRADYLGRVSLLDFCVNRLARTVAARDDASTTWTVVTSQRGHLLGEHGLVGPRSFLAGALEVPVIVAPPENAAVGTAARLEEGLVSTVDVAATLADLAGCDVPVPMPGRSLLPMLAMDAPPRSASRQGDGARHEADAEALLPRPAGGNLSEFGDRLMLETERFKVVYDRATRDCRGLFDLLHDPEERSNLLETPRGRNLIDALRWRVADALMPLCAAHGVVDGR